MQDDKQLRVRSVPHGWPRALRSWLNATATSGTTRMRAAWEAPYATAWRDRIGRWPRDARAGMLVTAAGTVLVTLLIAAFDSMARPLPNPGVVYLPLVAMVAYYWNWRYGAAAGALALICVYYFFQPPLRALTPVSTSAAEQLIPLAAVTAFMLALVQLARSRRVAAEREAGRLASLTNVGRALTQELHEERLLHLIAETARDMTGAEFAAFTLRPIDALGRPLVPAEGSLFHLAAVVGVRPEQEALFRRMPLGGEGLLAPIFRHGAAVRVADVLAVMQQAGRTAGGADAASVTDSPRESARQIAFAYAHGRARSEDLRGIGYPRGHPVARSFLGVPLFDSAGDVRGGLLLGHSAPGRFTQDHEAVLLGLAAQASVTIENARLYRAAQAQTQELTTLFQSIADGVIVVDARGQILRENRAARELRETLEQGPEAAGRLAELVDVPASHALAGETDWSTTTAISAGSGERRDYFVTASPLRSAGQRSDAERLVSGAAAEERSEVTAAVVVWHDVTEARRLLEEQRARADAEARRALLQVLLDELPSGVYLVRGPDARLVLANRTALEVWGADWAEGVPMAAFLQSAGTRVFAADGQPIPTESLATLQAVRTGQAVRHQQEIIRHADGTTLPILLNAVALDAHALNLARPDPVTGESGGEETGALVVLQDVSALKEAERLKDEFIAIAAHELRNPMAAIKGYADMLTRADGRGSRLADWQTEALDTIDQATSRLVELTDDLLDVTRLQAGRLELSLEPHDLVALTRRVVKRLQVTTQRHTLTVEANADFIVVCIDVKRMEQVLGNLIGNAIKYSPAGGLVVIGIHEDARRRTVVLSVRDHGIGIPAGQHARMFSRFARADNAREQGITGTGLGLYLTRELVELQGGRVWFDSVEGQGSTFYVELQLLRDSAEVRAEHAPVHE